MGSVKKKPKFHELTVSEVRRETSESVSLAFEVPEHLMEHYSFVPGQHLTLRATVMGKDIRRSYSLCSNPSEQEWRVAVKCVDQGQFSNYVHTTVQPGDSLEVMTPVGDFRLQALPNNKKSYVLFAAGSGITPILSILKEILFHEPLSDVTLFYGNKNFSSVIFREVLEGLKNKYMNRFRVIHIFSREDLGNELQRGRIDAQKCEKLYRAFLGHQAISAVFVCGPEEMISAVKETFEKLGLDKTQIHSELFTPSDAIIHKKKPYTGPHIEANVRVIFDGASYNIDMSSSDEALLDAARKAGADIPYSCKGGVCSTCKAKVLEGEARMDVNYALETDELEKGYILACQAHPVTQRLVVSFDE